MMKTKYKLRSLFLKGNKNLFEKKEVTKIKSIIDSIFLRYNFSKYFPTPID